MRVFFEEFNSKVRMQPYGNSNHITPGKYYNFRKQPHKIRTHLEEYAPYSDYPATQDFYSLIEWLNSDESNYETNDCRFYEIKKNKDIHLSTKKLVGLGLFTFFFRDIHNNLSPDSRKWSDLYQQFKINEDGFRLKANRITRTYVELIENELKNVERDVDNDCISIGLAPTFFSDAKMFEKDRYGYSIGLKYWVWGEKESEVFTNLECTIDSISKTLKKLNAEMLNFKRVGLNYIPK